MKIVVKQFCLSNENTDRLLRFCEKENISVTSLVGSIQLVATKKIIFGQSSAMLGICLAVDLRGRDVGYSKYRSLCVCVSFIFIMLRVSEDANHIKLARELGNNVANQLRRNSQYVLIKMFPFMRVIMKPILSWFQIVTRGYVLLSSIGAIEHVLSSSGKPLENISFWVPPAATQLLSCCIAMSGGMMRVGLVSFEDQ